MAATIDIDLASLIATSGLAVALAALSWIDLRERRLPDRITLPLIVLGLALFAWREHAIPVAGLVGATAGFVLFWALGELHFRLRGIEGLGLGDAKLLAAAGAWLGWRALPALILIAALAALAWTLLGQPHRRDIAFGPWLALAFLSLWLWTFIRESL